MRSKNTVINESYVHAVGIEIVEEAIYKNRLKTLVAEASYDTQGDNFELYMVEE